jgi:hypothetical protein
MVKTKGPVWHKKQKDKGIIPKGLRGIDRDATWSKSKTDGWIYGHGTFSLVSHKIPVLGCFMWMRNSRNESKRLWMETSGYTNILKKVIMDSKADDYALFREFKKQRKMTLLTVCRKEMNKTAERRKMIATMKLAINQKYLKERSQTVEPMQGIVKDVFELECCWMRGNESNRWLFSAMGMAIQMAQLKAYRENKSTWKIKSEVLGYV